MWKKNQIAAILTILVMILAVLLIFQIRTYFQPFGVSMIDQERAEELKAGLTDSDADMREEILFNQGSTIFDTDTNTIYITQNQESERVGEFTAIHAKTHLYWIEDEYFYNMEEAIRSAHEFTFLYISQEGYTEGKLVCTSLPILSFDKLYSDKTDYFGDLTVSSSSGLEGNVYNRKTSYAKVEQKDVSTSPYEREYRIHLLKMAEQGEDAEELPDSIEEAEEKLVKNNMQLLEMEKNDDWELHPIYSDSSMIREKLARDLWKSITADTDYADYAMEMKYTEVVMNGKYMGVYGLVEHSDNNSLSLQIKDRLYEDVVPQSVFLRSDPDVSNYIDYALFLQCMDNVEEGNEKKQFVARYLEKSGKYELFRFPRKLEDLLRNDGTGIVEDMELQDFLQESDDADAISGKIENRWSALRENILSSETIENSIRELETELSVSGAIAREEALRKDMDTEADTQKLLQFLTDRLVLLDEYYKSSMSVTGTDTKAEKKTEQTTEQTTEQSREYRADTLNPGIPTMYVTIDESKGTIAEMRANKGTNAYGNIYIKVPEDYTAEYVAGNQGDYSGELTYIRCRGQSSFNTDKKSYKVELDKKAELFGMGKSKDWVLIANAYDESMLRNKLAYWLADDMGLRDSPKSVYVNVVMNGEKLGCFILAQQPDVGEDRVEISEPEEETSSEDYSYMVEIMPEGRAVREQNIMAGPYSDIYYHVKYPKEIDTGSEYFQSIVSSLLNIDYLLYGQENYDLKELEQYIDIESFVNYYWVQEIFKNTDAMYASTFFYRDVGGKIKVGPVWDFDLSIGSYLNNGTERPQGWYVRDCEIYERLFRNPEFTRLVLERYEEIRPELEHLFISEGDNTSVMEMYTTQMGEDRQANLEMWGVTLGFKPVKTPNFIKQDTMEEADAYIVSWLTQRLQWMDENLNNLGIEGTVNHEGINGK